ncbi:MAG: phospholipase D-like domain-containing protein [Methanomassiliicoccaceae archaeon]|nr:phospholipase D-like domain-containing protein [Methanomassiliicoccaceae archaeon]
MNRIAAILAVTVILAVPFLSCGASGDNDEHLWLYEIMPAGSFEAVTLYNAGSVTVNLKNYYLDDGEGTVRFNADIYVQPKTAVTISSAAPDTWLTDRNVMIYGTNGIVAKSFILADAGDEVMLRKTSNGEVIDTFVYGNGDTSVKGWKGDAFGRITSGKMAIRYSMFDTDTANDWRLSSAGRTGEKINSAGMFDALITPFVFPDSKGDPVFAALEDASDEVLISIYILDHRDIVSLLMALMERGVSVTIFLEGSPAGGVPDTEIRYMTALYEKGASVYFLKGHDGYKRYDLVHNKYAVIDSRTVAITSENWRESSFTGNRGWGAVIESDGYAEYMRHIFTSDCDPSRYDLFGLKEIYPSAASISVPQYKPRIVSHYETFNASVRPVISPDFSFEYLKQEISGASERIYAEQMTIQYTWTDTTVQSPLSWSLTASNSGVDVRILADVTFATDDDGVSRDNYTVVSIINDMDGMQARTISGGEGFGLTHNKGVIIDDTVWISSINWSNAAFMNNREAAAVIYSADVADYYAYYFLTDWGSVDMSVRLEVNVTGDTAGEAVILDASSSTFPQGTLFGWDTDGDGIADRSGIKIAMTFPEGVNHCVLMATDPSGSVYYYEFTVMIHPKGANTAFFEPYVKYAPFIAILLAILAVTVFVRMRGRRR